MERKLINWMGVLGIISLISYALAVIISPVAYPGYNWMEQAVSDLSADNAPSKALWDQLSALYSSCGLVSVTCVSVFVADNRVASRLFRTGIYLFAVMNWVSGMGYRMFPLVDAGKEIASFQEVMHIVVTALVVILSITSLVVLIIAGFRQSEVRTLGRWGSDNSRFQAVRSQDSRQVGSNRTCHDDDWSNRNRHSSSAILRNSGKVQCVCCDRL